MRISAFTQIIVTVAVTAWVFILPVKAVATILVFELALLLSIKRDRMTMAAIGGLAVFTGLMILFQLLFGSPLEVALTGGLRMLVMRAVAKSETLALSMELKGFGSNTYKNMPREPLGAADFIVLGLVVVLSTYPFWK